MDHNLKCGRCGRPAPPDLKSPAAADWSGQWTDGRLTLVICPDDQTPADSAEAEANAAELRVQRQDGGQFFADPVICMTGTMGQPGQILYGHDHLRRVLVSGKSEAISALEDLPADTRCVPTVGGVMVHLPGSADT